MAIALLQREGEGERARTRTRGKPVRPAQHTRPMLTTPANSADAGKKKAQLHCQAHAPLHCGLPFQAHHRR